MVWNRPADGGGTTTLIVGDICALRSALGCERTLASIRHAKVEVNISILVGVNAEVGDGESINVTAAADRGRRRSTPRLGDGTGNAFVLSGLENIDCIVVLE